MGNSILLKENIKLLKEQADAFASVKSMFDPLFSQETWDTLEWAWLAIQVVD
jgi:hypothetical protein